jgi:hypothetical protein
MSRPSVFSQIVRVFVMATALAVGGMGCGSGTGGGGNAGAGGGGTCTLDQVNAIFQTTGANVGCTVIGACHDNAGSAAGLDLTTAGWQTKLVGMGPVAMKGAATTLYSLCAGKNLMYLNAGSKPATGLFLDKLKPKATAPCGVHMPNIGTTELTAAQFECVQSYATTLTSP